MSQVDDSSVDRVTELLADRAIVGLTVEEAEELARLGGGREAESLALEISAARVGVVLGQFENDELPLSLQTRLETLANETLDPPAKAEPRKAIVVRMLPWLGWAAAAAMILTTAPGLFRAPDPPSSLDPLAGLKPLPLKATDHPLARGARGSLVWSEDRQQGCLAIEGLAEVEPDRGVYQLWIFDATRDERYPVDGGTFAIRDSQQTTRIPIHAALKVGKPGLFAITLEPPGGVVVSDRKRIVLTASP